MIIVLVGYMGCGKSSVGKQLAEDLQMEYLDLDAYISKKEEKTIPEIFKEKGEVYFRKKETKYLKEILKVESNTVLSLGGGTPCFASNIELINAYKDTKSIYLKTSLEQLADRLYTEKESRPLISHLESPESLQEFIAKHLFERSFYYQQAMITMVTDTKSVQDIASEIRKALD